MPRLSRSPFTAPGEQGRGVWRALAEVAGGVLLISLGQVVVSSPDEQPPLSQYLLSVPVLGLFAVRRRYPVVSLLGIAALAGAQPAAGLPAAVTAYTATRQLTAPRRRTALLLASTVLVLLTSTALAAFAGSEGQVSGPAVGAVLAATALLVPGLVGTSVGQQDRLMPALRERAAAAEEARRLAESESRMQERSRIAAEMHDLVGHRLSLISLHAGGLEMALRDESAEMRDEAALVRRATGDAMQELREVLGVLGPLGRDTGTGALTDTTGTRSDIEALAEESRSGGIPVELTWEGADLDDRPAQVRRAVHRVVRESLTNVHRHAAGAHVTIGVTHTDDRVEVRVRNGRPPLRGSAQEGSGRGLVGLRERVSLLGGELESGPTPAGGFAVTAHIPAQPDPHTGTAGAGDARPEPAGPGTERVPSRVQRRVVGALTGLLGLTGVSVMILFGLFLVSEANRDPHVAEEVEPRIGMHRAELESSLFDDIGVRAAATGHEPARPASATECIYPMVPSEDFLPLSVGAGMGPMKYAPFDAHEGPGQLRITRYCFRGDELTAIDRFNVPVASQTPSWESP
ncbi:sensor histidine kinase [Streptomyces xiaopingdaonensis]|uniref:sensor histidine kinase n=1 Tax=Streptomyces xiaopingdaonensis TaxID=1565415 RepID=UPI0002FC8EDA|nr:histidine kinase [Streptomyces xiaopingdaonensis]